MPETGTSEQTPTAQGETPTAPVESSPQSSEGAGGQRAILADLARERDQRQALQKQVDELKELKPLKEQMQRLQSVFGNQSADPGEDIVSTLQQRVSAMEKENVVSRVARGHGFTDEKFIKALRNQPDEQAMNDLAELLKSTAPSSPAPDPSQASAPMTPEAAEKAAYEAFFPSRT